MARRDSSSSWSRAALEQNRGWLLAFILAQIGNPSDADDLVQEVFTRVLQRRDRYDPSLPFGAWLRGIARNVVREYWRQKRCERIVATDEAMGFLEAAAAAQEAKCGHPEYRDARLGALRECLKQLSERMRVILQMKYEAGMKSDTIGQRLGMSQAAVDMALCRSRKVLLTCVSAQLKEWDV